MFSFFLCSLRIRLNNGKYRDRLNTFEHFFRFLVHLKITNSTLFSMKQTKIIMKNFIWEKRTENFCMSSQLWTKLIQIQTNINFVLQKILRSIKTNKKTRIIFATRFTFWFLNENKKQWILFVLFYRNCLFWF